MAKRTPLKIKYSIVDSYPATRQASWLGAQATANKRGWWPELASHPDNGIVYGTKIYNGILYAVGTFTSVAGGTVRKGTAAWNIYTGVLQAWTVDLGTTVDGRCVEADATGVYIGGAFTNANSVTGQKYLIKTDLTVGTIDSSFTQHPDATVYCSKIIAKADGITPPNYQLLIGGSFSKIGAVGTHPKIAIVSMTTGARVSGGSPTACNGDVYAVGTDYASNGADLTTGVIYAVGAFTSFNGTARNRAAAVVQNGGGWVANSWNPNLNDNGLSILNHPNGLIYLGGKFTTANGGTARTRACAVDATYGTLTAWDPGFVSNINCLNYYEDVVFCGMDPSGASHTAEAVDLAGNKLDWPLGGNSGVFSLSVFERTVYVGGQFTQIKGLSYTALSACPWPYMNDSNTIFVAKAGSDAAAGTAAAPVYTLAQALTLVTSTFKYVQVTDSGIYNEDFDLAATTQVFAADGQAPTLTRYPGAEVGTFGARTTGRKKFFTGSGAVVRYVSKIGNDSTGAAGDATLPYLTIQAAITACSDGDCVSVVDSEIYQETLVVAHSITLQAADGKVPVLVNLGTAAHTINVTSAKTLSLYGFTIIGPSFYTGTTYNCITITSGGLTALYDCTISGGSTNLTSAANTVHTDIRNNVFSKPLGYQNVEMTVAGGIGAGTSYFQNNYVSADSAAPGLSSINSVDFYDPYTKYIKNNTVMRAPKATEGLSGLAAGLSTLADDSVDGSITVIESNYVSGAGCGIRVICGTGSSQACSLTVKNNYATLCDIGYNVWDVVTTAPSPTITIKNNVGYKNGQNLPVGTSANYGDFSFILTGTHNVSINENLSIGSYSNGFFMQFNPGVSGTPTIFFRKNVALNAALNGLYCKGLPTTATVSGVVPGTPYQLTPTPPSSAAYMGNSAVTLYAARGGTGWVPMDENGTPGAQHDNDAGNQHLVYNQNGSGTYTFSSDTRITGATAYMSFFTDNIYGVIGSGSKWEGNVFKGNTIAGVAATQMKTSVQADATQNYFEDNGSINSSVVNAPGAATPVNFFLTLDAVGASGQEGFRKVLFVSSTPGAEELGLLPDSPGRFCSFLQASTPQDDVGMNNYMARFAADRSGLDGFYVTGYANLWGGISLAKNVKDFQLAYCTISQCAFHGVRHLGVSNTSRPWLRNCDLASNDNGAIDFNPGNTIKYSAFRDNSGAGLYLFLGAARVSLISTFRNGTGIFESIFAAPSLIDKVISSQNALADATGQASLYTNSVVSVPQGVILDTTCSQLNPLFKDPINGDLRLQAIADGDLFDSPAIALAAGAYSYTYGPAVEGSTTLDFATTGWHNPDKRSRSIMPVKLSEGVKLLGKTYSKATSYKVTTEYSWGKQNDMLDAQLQALIALYSAADENIQISEDGGATWVDRVLVKSRTPTFRSIADGDFVQDDMPEPYDRLTVREP